MRHLKSAVCFLGLALALAGAVIGESTITITVLDPPGFGFLDDTPYTAQPGNGATTLGGARLNALRFAVALWAQALSSPVPISVSARFEAFGPGTVLARGGSDAVYVDFPSAPALGVRYPAALADRFAGFDLGGGEGHDVVVVVNADVDQPPGGVAVKPFYYGLDADPPLGHSSFLTMALHELAHGFGLSLGLDLDSGKLPAGGPNVYDTLLMLVGAQSAPMVALADAERVQALGAQGSLVWSGPLANSQAVLITGAATEGGQLELHALGSSDESSGSHVTRDAAPDELMESINLGSVDLCLTYAMLADLGWANAADCVQTVEIGPQAGPQVVGESGAVSVAQTSRTEWQSIAFVSTLNRPVVFAQVTSDPGVDPVSVRIRNVTPAGFEFQLQEWSYQDGSRIGVDVSWITFEQGIHSLPGGLVLEAGRATVSEQFATVGLSAGFTSDPVVVSQAQSVIDSAPVVTRQRNITVGGFEVRLQEEEQAESTGQGAHSAEIVGYVAALPGSSVSFEVGTVAGVTDAWLTQSFGTSLLPSPGVIVQLATYADPDTGVARVRGLEASSVEVGVAEEASADAELVHEGEQVHFIAFSDQGPILSEGWVLPTFYFDPAYFDSSSFETGPGGSP